jgi:small-conductance mechanosensitive channel
MAEQPIKIGDLIEIEGNFAMVEEIGARCTRIRSGGNALIFDLYFCISMNRIMDRRVIESDIRYRIDELFREAGIVIAFPQRDIHLDTQKPLEFCLVNNPGDPNAIPKG